MRESEAALSVWEASSVVMLGRRIKSWVERLSAAVAEERVTCRKVGRPCWIRRMAVSRESVSMAAARDMWRDEPRTKSVTGGETVEGGSCGPPPRREQRGKMSHPRGWGVVGDELRK
jgi:hypothetical protein